MCQTIEQSINSQRFSLRTTRFLSTREALLGKERLINVNQHVGSQVHTRQYERQSPAEDNCTRSTARYLHHRRLDWLEMGRAGGATRRCGFAKAASLAMIWHMAGERCGPDRIICVNLERRGSMSAAFLTQSPGLVERERHLISSDSEPARLSATDMVLHG